VGLLLFNLQGRLVIMLTGPSRLFFADSKLVGINFVLDPTEVRKRKCKGEKIHRFLEL
jgi:hypothetical protein